MIWAKKGDATIQAFPGAHATCPLCSGPVLAKCGDINTWHWAHKSLDCDPWSEPETEWHKKWKAQFPMEWQEVVIGNHRADIKTPSTVIEFQASHISAREIAEREDFYGRMVWVLRGADFWGNMTPIRNDYYKWKWPRKAWWAARRPIYIDTRYELLRVDKVTSQKPCRITGTKIHYYDFLKYFGAYAPLPEETKP